MYFATLTEVPILEGLIKSGMGQGPALALLLAGPALSLPSMLVIRSVMGTKKTVVYVGLVIVLSTIAGMAYGALIPFTGFYWDDLPFTWIAHFLGPREFIPAFMPYRPFLGPIFYVTTSLVPPVPLYWQVARIAAPALAPLTRALRADAASALVP